MENGLNITAILSGITFPVFVFAFIMHYRLLIRLNIINNSVMKEEKYSFRELKKIKKQSVNSEEIKIIDKIIFYGRLKNIFFVPIIYFLVSLFVR